MVMPTPSFVWATFMLKVTKVFRGTGYEPSSGIASRLLKAMPQPRAEFIGAPPPVPPKPTTLRIETGRPSIESRIVSIQKSTQEGLAKTPLVAIFGNNSTICNQQGLGIVEKSTINSSHNNNPAIVLATSRTPQATSGHKNDTSKRPPSTANIVSQEHVSQLQIDELTQTLKSVEQGDTKAQFRLGDMFMEANNGAPKIHRKALEWYLKAANGGLAAAQNKLGTFYKDGLGQIVSQDHVKALDWFFKAANQGRVESQMNVGRMYSIGDSVPQDFAKAAEW
ncbi:hypothetical protein BGX33_011406 [Mortierella sp. NVP41]|nr:hypothetical protein BGX33_011406 [Mortierella sp. NVP41]